MKEEDLIHYPYAGVRRHPHMSNAKRAAQFKPFAALSGYEEAIEESGRITIERKEMHEDALKPGDRVLVLDDLLATGGTALACCKLVKRAGAEVAAAAFIIELTPLKGREKIEADDVKVVSMLKYDLD